MSIGIWQILIVVLLMVLLFGRGKISDLMGDMAKGIKSFKQGLSDDDVEVEENKPIEHKQSEAVAEAPREKATTTSK